MSNIAPASHLTPVHFVGSLGRAIGHSLVHLDVKSPAEALRAMNIMTKGKLEDYLTGPGKNKLYKIALQKKENVIDPKEAQNRSGRSAIYIMPTIRGRDSGFGKILVGAALIALAIFAPGTLFITAQGGLTALGAVTVGFGTSLLLGGITQLITPSARGPTTTEATEQKQSTAFVGGISTVAQGTCVPVVYGHAIVDAVPVAISINNSDLVVTSAGNPGDVEVIDLPGGGQQYRPIPGTPSYPEYPY